MCGEDKSCGCATLQTGGVLTAAPMVVESDAEVIAPGVQPDEGTTPELEAEWHACLAIEGIRTLDRRRIADGALSWREVPLALFAQFNNDGHEKAPIVGKITAISREEGSGRIMAEGEFDLSIPEGVQAAQMCANETLRFGSVDLKVQGSRKVGIMTEQGMSPEGVPADVDWYDEILEGVIAGWTMIAIPAIPQAVIAPRSRPLPDPLPSGSAPVVTQGLLASGDVPMKPPSEWFQDPKLPGVTPLTVTADGRVFGHLALWDTCHIGFQDQCVTPPRSTKDYAYFLTGEIETLEGSPVRVGHITYNTGHAGATMGYSETAAHYDHTGAVAADVTAGEDEFGIWVAGSMRPGVGEEGMRAVKSAPLSGDWRKIGGNLELVAALSVNVPGFPIVASAGFDESKTRVSLIAGGVQRVDEIAVLRAEVASLRASVAPLLTASVKQMAERVNAPMQFKLRSEVESLAERVNDAFYNKTGKNQYTKGGKGGGGSTDTFYKGPKSSASSNPIRKLSKKATYKKSEDSFYKGPEKLSKKAQARADRTAKDNAKADKWAKMAKQAQKRAGVKKKK